MFRVDIISLHTESANNGRHTHHLQSHRCGSFQYSKSYIKSEPCHADYSRSDYFHITSVRWHDLIA